jgi:hypothetical protein
MVVRPFREVSEKAFTFVINGIGVLTNAAEAAAFSLVVAPQLSVDACARKFVVCDGRFDSATVSSFWRTLIGRSFGSYPVDAYRFEVLCELLSNPELECSWVSSGLLEDGGSVLNSIPLLPVEALDAMLLEGIWSLKVKRRCCRSNGSF